MTDDNTRPTLDQVTYDALQLYHAMARLRRRCDEGLWDRVHIKKARKWLEESYVEAVN